MTALRVPLQINAPIGIVGQPVTVGVPFPRGSLREPERLCLADAEGKSVPLQVKPLARWADGSVKWLLCDFVIGAVTRGQHCWILREIEAASLPHPASLTLLQKRDEIRVNTGEVDYRVSRIHFSIEVCGCLVGFSPPFDPSWGQLDVTDRGCVRTALCIRGLFQRCDYVAELAFYAGTGLLRVRAALVNSRSARHKGGLWDLGDRNSRQCEELGLSILSPANPLIEWSAEFGQPLVPLQGQTLEIFQGSSGGANWNSRNHVNRYGRIACPFRGYCVRQGERVSHGLRADPLLLARYDTLALMIAVPEFWQQFPRAVQVKENELTVGLFPKQFTDQSELQGGEQKTHTLWLHFGSASDTGVSLDWVHRPAVVLPDPDWTAASGLFPFLPAELANERCQTLLTEALEGPDNFFAKREAIDEYGWRHYGEVYADHENEHYTGPKPIVSHYNNQYDILNGFLTNYLRTGDPRWWALADPLARHICDIDIYHTDRDRPAYNGGMFWHTDHYKDAGTATHRAYSKANKKPGQPYGGGPGNEHNWSTGLLHYYYFTGDPLAHEAVLSLANWVINRDDGKLTLLGLIDDGPTGLSSRTGGDGSYHGPGRGGGNSINSLLDAWLLTGELLYLDKAEELVRRCIHPADDLDALDMGNPEERWSYTVFLSVLVRYLELKREAGQADACYAYARASLLHYGRWMAKNEKPYFDQVERLEFPNETWAAQEMRKANVLRLAARYAEGAERDEMLRRGAELADRSWHDVFRFASRTSTRCLAILLTEGPRDSYLRTHAGEVVAEKGPETDFGAPSNFVPQRLRIKRQLRTAGGILRAILRILDVRRWPRALRARQL